MCFAEDEFVIPSGSSFKVASEGEMHGDYTTFTGSTIVAGKFIIGWQFVDDEPEYLKALIYTDLKSSNALPYEKGQEKVSELILADPEKAAMLILNPDQAKKILSKELITTSGETIVKVKNFETAIECDNRWYRTSIIEVVVTRIVADSTNQEHNYGC